jgi:hypothetical protein
MKRYLSASLAREFEPRLQSPQEAPVHRSSGRAISLTLGVRTELLGLVDFLLRARNCLGQDGRVPKLAKIRHGDSPMRHGALFVLRSYSLKCAAGVCIRKGVEQGDTSVELLLNFGLTGNWKGDAKFFGCSMAVGLLRSRRHGKDKQQREEDGPQMTSFSPEVAWQSCAEYYSDAGENARGFDRAIDVP